MCDLCDAEYVGCTMYTSRHLHQGVDEHRSLPSEGFDLRNDHYIGTIGDPTT